MNPELSVDRGLSAIDDYLQEVMLNNETLIRLRIIFLINFLLLFQFRLLLF